MIVALVVFLALLSPLLIQRLLGLKDRSRERIYPTDPRIIDTIKRTQEELTNRLEVIDNRLTKVEQEIAKGNGVAEPH